MNVMDELTDKLSDAIFGAIVTTLANDPALIQWLTTALQKGKKTMVSFVSISTSITSNQSRGVYLSITDSQGQDVYSWYYLAPATASTPADVKAWLLSLV